MFIIILFLLGCDSLSDLLFFSCPLCFFPYYVSLTFFVCFFILFHSCCSHAQVFGKHWCMSSPFPIAILNGSFFRSVKAMINCNRSSIKQILLN